MNLSATIAAHIANARFEQLSPRAVQMSKYSLLDALGVMLGASGLGEGCDAFARLAIEAQAKPEATILGYGVKTSASLAALANGAMAHALDFEDAHDKAPVHPNAQVIPAALAVAELLGSVSGKELITAIALGCDLTCRLALCLTRSIDEFGWYPPPIFGAFGATAAAAKLLKLSASQTLDALSLVLCQNSCSGEIKTSPHSTVRSIRDAFAAQAGVVAAQLALNGVRGFEQPLEGKAGFFNNFARGHYDVEVLLKDLGARYESENVSLKPWPACRGTHAFIEAALTLMQQHHIKPADIASGHMIGHKVQRMLYEPLAQKQNPATAIDAKFSLPFTVAATIAHGEVTLDTYAESSLADREVLALAKRLSFAVSDDSAMSDNATRGELRLTLYSGATHSLFIEHPRGHESNPLTEADLIAKAMSCARWSRSSAGSSTNSKTFAQAIDAVMHLDQIDDLQTQLFSQLP